MIPYGVWNNRTPGEMRIWLPTKEAEIDVLIQQLPVRHLAKLRSFNGSANVLKL